MNFIDSLVVEQRSSETHIGQGRLAIHDVIKRGHSDTISALFLRQPVPRNGVRGL